jgi:hypothetical protein
MCPRQIKPQAGLAVKGGPGLIAGRSGGAIRIAALALAARALTALPAAPIFPEALGDPSIAGFRFPEREATITEWITAMFRDDAPSSAAAARGNICLRGWGLWTALTELIHYRLSAFDAAVLNADEAGTDAQANYHPARLPTAPRFAGARHVDPSEPQFYGTLQVDFLWSIARHAR